MRREEPAEVTTGWNGIAAFDADLVLPSIPSAHPCPESECFAIVYGMRRRTVPKWARIYVNVQVNVAVASLQRDEPSSSRRRRGFRRKLSCLYRKLATPPSVPASSRLALRGDTPWTRIASPSRACTTCTCEFDKIVVFLNGANPLSVYSKLRAENLTSSVFLTGTQSMRDPRLTRQRTMDIWPYFSHNPVAVARLRREEPVEVATCCNGVAVFDANYPSPTTHPLAFLETLHHCGRVRYALTHGAEAAAHLRAHLVPRRLMALLIPPPGAANLDSVVLNTDAQRRVRRGNSVQYQGMYGFTARLLRESMGGFLIPLISRSIPRLLDTKGGDLAFVCGLAFGGIGLHDTWLISDSCGQRTKETHRLRREEPVEVAACWKGVVLVGLTFFLAVRLNRLYRKLATSLSVPACSPLAFRGDAPCPESECFVAREYDMCLPYTPRKLYGMLTPSPPARRAGGPDRAPAVLLDVGPLSAQGRGVSFEREGVVEEGHCEA
ncbi:hypothetical protein DFH06DRAFT_1351234 [Mycena polygramma]|nr:hypothetical protein DFH06DRAFT_1351234 [Mycena polygramma]